MMNFIDRMIMIPFIVLIILIAFVAFYPMMNFIERVMLFIGIMSLIASVISLRVAYRAFCLQKKADKDLKKMDLSIEGISDTQEKLKIGIEKTEENTKIIKETAKQMEDNLNKTYFQMEKNTTLREYEYLNNEDLKNKLNESYKNLIHYLFSDLEPNICITTSNKLNKQNKKKELRYNIEVIKDIAKVPKTKMVLGFKFYIIKIISPCYPTSIPEEQLNEYEDSPIKEGEYYACRFDEQSCSWILGQQLTLGRKPEEGFYPFYVEGFESKPEMIPSANQVMGHTSRIPTSPKTQLTNQDTDQEYIETFIIEDYYIQLYKKNNQIFFKIGDSPLKKIYIFENQDMFLVFEYLRGYRVNKKFKDDLKNVVLHKAKDLSIEIDRSYEKDHHIKVCLTPEDKKILTDSSNLIFRQKQPKGPSL